MVLDVVLTLLSAHGAVVVARLVLFLAWPTPPYYHQRNAKNVSAGEGGKKNRSVPTKGKWTRNNGWTKNRDGIRSNGGNHQENSAYDDSRNSPFFEAKECTALKNSETSISG
jgi:hypothetical protein